MPIDSHRKTWLSDPNQMPEGNLRPRPAPAKPDSQFSSGRGCKTKARREAPIDGTNTAEPSNFDTSKRRKKTTVRVEAPVDKLCTTCRQLNLSTQKFVPGQTATSNLPGFLASCTDVAGLKPVNLGFLDQIYLRREHCSLCWLIFQGTHSMQDQTASTGHRIGYDGLTEDGKQVNCWIEWQLDGRFVQETMSERGSRSPTRRLRIFSPEKYWTDTHVISMAPRSVSSAESSFLARKIAPSVVDIGILKKWLRLCTENHSCRPLGAFQGSREFLHHLYFIDVTQQALVKSDWFMTEYATLSYVWGYVQVRSTQEAPYQWTTPPPKGMVPIATGLSRTIRDAMHLARSLGIKYLWVDKLCINQTCMIEKVNTISVMHKIYGNAVLNICAATGDAGDGISGSPMTPRKLAESPVATCAGLELMAMKSADSRIQNTVWNTRGWIFQERILSKRSIIFVPGCVIFQCREATWSEQICSESSVPTWTLEMVHSPFTSMNKNPVRLYLEYVELYTARNLIHNMDKIAAFKGVLAMLEPLLESSFLFGLANSYFDLALLWELKNTQGRNMNPRFPSWSWSGWGGCCIWRVSMISGVLLDLHQWLISHTWVIWHKLGHKDYPSEGIEYADTIPDDADFQPVRISSDLISASLPSRWRGYATIKDATEPYGRQKVMAGGEATPMDDNEQKPTYPRSPHRSWSCLYFWTYTAFFQLSRESRTSSSFTTKLEPGLHRFSLLDSNGD